MHDQLTTTTAATAATTATAGIVGFRGSGAFNSFGQIGNFTTDQGAVAERGGVADERAASDSVEAAATDTGDKDADVLGQVEAGLLQCDEDGRVRFQGVQQVLRV